MKKNLEFFKAQATGNDFIILDGIKQKINLTTEQIKKLCHRHLGIGADGILIINKDDKYDFRMKFFNPDGSVAKFCGNGARAIVKTASLLGYIKEKTNFIADDGPHYAEINKLVAIKMKDVSHFFLWKKEYIFIDTGTQHTVKFVKKIKKLNIEPEAKQIRYHQDFSPDGTNVNFVEIFDNYIFVRTYEKGVEEETLSCGTGVVASALAHHLKNNAKPPIKIITNGGKLYVDFYFDNSKKIFKKVILKGPAQILFKGLWYENNF